jgi:phenylalanyl-tRNA synthetase alpha chain
LEIDAWQPEKKIWLEIGGAGIFRPEVTESLLGKPIPVLAWGPGFDRMIMNIFGIKDMREVYKNDITQLRKLKVMIK